MNILVTGEKGFLGSKLVEADDGWDIKDGKDISDLDNLRDVHYDLVINCAAEMFDKDNMVWTNVLGVESVARYCKRERAKLIHFSTVTIFGEGYYGATKRMGEEVIQQINPKDWLILRMTNVYGPGSQSPANRFENGEKDIFGEGYHIKDHVHVRDITHAVRMAITDNWTGIVNLSSGKPATIREVFRRFGTGEPNFLLDRKPDIQVSVLDNSRALSLGWKPTWSVYDHQRTDVAGN